LSFQHSRSYCGAGRLLSGRTTRELKGHLAKEAQKLLTIAVWFMSYGSMRYKIRHTYGLRGCHLMTISRIRRRGGYDGLSAGLLYVRALTDVLTR